MKLKAKLISTIAAVCMVVCLLSVGIWAVSKGTVNIGGNVSFTADNVYVQIDGTVSGSTNDANKVLGPIVWNSETVNNVDSEPTDGKLDALIESWDLSGLVFANNAGTLSPITVTLTIKNLSTQRKATVKLTDNTTIEASDDVTMEISGLASNRLVLEPSTGVQDQTNNIATITITLTPKDLSANNTVDAFSFNIDVSIENGEVA